MAKKSSNVEIGHWSFIIGLVLAVLAGLVIVPYSATILFVLGLIVGFMNVSEKESSGFLIAVIALLVIGVAGISAMNNIVVVGALTDTLMSMIEQFISFIAAAGLVVALKHVIATGK